MNGIRAEFTGRLGADPTLRYTATGKPMVQFNVALDEDFHATAERPAPETTWIRTVAFEELADDLAEVLAKGSAVQVEGRIRFERWTGQDGQSRSGLGCM